MMENPCILYCRCAFARVVPTETKDAVLEQLVASEVPFEAVADLCEMSARKDPRLQQLIERQPLAIAACYPRAVKWLFAAGGAPLPAEGVEVLNMRTQGADEIVARLLAPAVAKGESS